MEATENIAHHAGSDEKHKNCVRASKKMLQDLIRFQVMAAREIRIQQKWKIKKARRNAEKIGYYGH